jgi:HlyD family secretion protein
MRLTATCSALHKGALARARPFRRLLEHTGRVALGLALLIGSSSCSGAREEYVRVAARRGPLTVSVAASGSLEALDQVNVVADVGGTVTDVYVKVNDAVESGQPLCQIDPEHWELIVQRTEAQLAENQEALATEQQALQAAELGVQRAEKRAGKSPKAVAELDALRATVEKARADEQVANAQLSATATALDQARTALDHTSIRSPMSGVVVARAVEPGQTLATTASAPVVFVLARDLRRMELRAFVDEADIGQLAVGQSATFTVDILADRRFPARLTSIRNQPLRVLQQVGFEARFEVENADAVLKPGMVARVAITTAQLEDAVLLPNAALRFAPEHALLDERRSLAGFVRRRPILASEPEAERTAWVITGNARPRPRQVAVGRSDGAWTEVVGGEVSAGDELAVDVRVRRN